MSVSDSELWLLNNGAHNEQIKILDKDLDTFYLSDVLDLYTAKLQAEIERLREWKTKAAPHLIGTCFDCKWFDLESDRCDDCVPYDEATGRFYTRWEKKVDGCSNDA